MATFGAFIDANVLYPSGLRNFFMHLSLTGSFHAYWFADVNEEWMRNLLKNRPDLTREKLERTRRLMDKALPNALVTGYDPLIDIIELPDRSDRHVLGAAIRCGASVIVTLNLEDFPSKALGAFSTEAQHHHLLRQRPGGPTAALGASLSPYSPEILHGTIRSRCNQHHLLQ